MLAAGTNSGGIQLEYKADSNNMSRLFLTWYMVLLESSLKERRSAQTAHKSKGRGLEPELIIFNTTPTSLAHCPE